MTIPTHTPITTAARRITTHANTTTAHLKTAYATDGTAVRSWPADMAFTVVPPDVTAATVIQPGRQHKTPMTWRESQDLLDAATYAAQRSGTGHRDVLEGDYLEQLRAERAAATEQASA